MLTTCFVFSIVKNIVIFTNACFVSKSLTLTHDFDDSIDCWFGFLEGCVKTSHLKLAKQIN